MWLKISAGSPLGCSLSKWFLMPTRLPSPHSSSKIPRKQDWRLQTWNSHSWRLPHWEQAAVKCVSRWHDLRRRRVLRTILFRYKVISPWNNSEKQKWNRDSIRMSESRDLAERDCVLWDQTVTAEWLKSPPSQEWTSERKLLEKAWLGWELEVGGRAVGGRCTPRMAAGPKRGLGRRVSYTEDWFRVRACEGVDSLSSWPHKSLVQYRYPIHTCPTPPPCLEEKVFF